MREVVIANKKPRRIELQPNIFLDPATSACVYKDYEATFAGIVQSYSERFADAFHKDVYDEWKQNIQLVRHHAETPGK